MAFQNQLFAHEPRRFGCLLKPYHPFCLPSFLFLFLGQLQKGFLCKGFARGGWATAHPAAQPRRLVAARPVPAARLAWPWLLNFLAFRGLEGVAFSVILIVLLTVLASANDSTTVKTRGKFDSPTVGS